MYCGVLLLSIVFFALIALVFHDIVYRRLPNKLVGVFFFSFFVFFLSKFTIETFIESIVIFVVTFLVASLFFLLRFMGGGDVKLWSVVMLWSGVEYAWPAIVIATLVGGIMAFLGLFARWRLHCMKHSCLRPVWSALTVDRGVPYGVGLSLAGMFVVYMRFQACLETT